MQFCELSYVVRIKLFLMVPIWNHCVIVNLLTSCLSVFISLKLRCHDDDVIDGVVCIFKTALFKLNHSPGSSFNNTRQIDSVLPLLLHLLDERDGTARAVAMLIAEYCSMYLFIIFIILYYFICELSWFMSEFQAWFW